MLLRFVEERGMKAYVFTSGMGLDFLCNDNMRVLTELVRAKGLLLYFVIYKEKKDSEANLVKEKQDALDNLEREGFHVTDILFVNPP